MDNFEIILNNAIKRCEGRIDVDLNTKGFNQIYPFTTENIAGYIDYFDLKNKSLLTVGSSSDQVINAILKDCKDITLIDINPYTKFYYYLKISTILCLDLNEFMRFLRFKDYPKVFKNNNEVFNTNSYNKIKSTLRILDYESYLFWDELFQTFNSLDIRNNLFSLDEDRSYVIQNCNNYLTDIKSYEETKNKIKKVIPNFIIDDLFKINLDRNFDNIWLSNIGTYLSRHFVKKWLIKHQNI